MRRCFLCARNLPHFKAVMAAVCIGGMHKEFIWLHQDLDEVQAYILLRRWQADHKDVVVKDHLTVEHLHSLGQAYFLERSYAIESLKLVLQLAEGDT